jgi:hypothetical protein
VPLTHPEFGYIGTSSFRRGLIAFVVCGVVAGASGIALFKPTPDPDPMRAMARAPAEALSSTKRSTLTGIAEGNSGGGEWAQETYKTGPIKPSCQRDATGYLSGNCTAVQTRRPRSIQALNERPAIAAVPIGHLDEPPVLPAGSAIAVTPGSVDSAIPVEIAPADAAPAVTEALPSAVSAKRTRTHATHVQHRDRNEYPRSASYSNRYYKPNYNNHHYSSGYARLW